MAEPSESSTRVPAEPQRLRRLATPRRLVVPYGRNGDGGGTVKPAGTVVRRGEPLVEGVTAGLTPRAPVDAKIISFGAACTGEIETSGIQLETLALPETGDAAETDAQPQQSAALTNLTAADLADKLGALGVWADRWASPDLLAQLRGPHRKPIDTIICNTLDEDPTVMLQANVAADRAADIAAAVSALAAASGAKKSLIAVAYYAPLETWENLRTACGQGGARLVPMINEYPQAHPTLIIHELTGRHLRPGQLPSEQGVLLLDAAAAAAVGAALRRDEPMLQEPLAVHDYLRKQTHFFWVPIGTAVGDVLEQIQVPQGDVELRAGCPLREIKLGRQCIIGGAELTVAIVPAAGVANPEPCIRCAWCVEGCPVNIRPAGLLDAAQQDDLFLASQCGLDACIECGICSYVCPSNLPLLPGVRVLRNLQAGSRRSRKTAL
jgi:electron transport complex protein RnfC